MDAHLFHSQQPSRPRSRPTLVYGGTAGLLGSANRVARQAHQEGYLALDLDLRHALVVPSTASLHAALAPGVLRLRSVWLPPTLGGPFLAKRLERLHAFLRSAQQELGLRHIVIGGANQATPPGTPLLPLAQGVIREQPGAVRLTLGVRADRSLHSLDGTALARRMAEEWDLDLALDLAGPVPPGWEAEAAVARMMPRLTIVRLCGWLPGSYGSEEESPTRIAARTMAMLADQGFAGLLSVVPTRHHRVCVDYQHDLQRRYHAGPYDADTPARTYFDLP